jgi:hypothetical protein
MKARYGLPDGLGFCLLFGFAAFVALDGFDETVEEPEQAFVADECVHDTFVMLAHGFDVGEFETTGVLNMELLTIHFEVEDGFS